jgi:serine/threonine protein kinase/tetratricopeptide (TPR) repeat protein
MNPDRWRLVDRIFEQVLDLPAAQRQTFLDDACLNDPPLREQVAALLSFDEKAQNRSGFDVVRDTAEMIATGERGSLAGEIVGPYRIDSLLGAGGMGEVYKAEDTRLARSVALKILPDYFTASKPAVGRFNREARVVSKLNHPNIVTIYEIAVIDDLHLIATELIEGQTLRQCIENGRGPLGQTLDIATQIASALAASHAAGIVHRDIKPENIMLRDDGLVKVLDFGLAKPSTVGRNIANSADINTGPGAVMGTAKYMSPEQAKGLEVDDTGDVYSLGVVIYELVTGQVPFEGETASHVIVSKLEKEAAGLTDLCPQAPVSLSRLVGRALRKNKEERYQTAGEMLKDLRRIQQEVDANPKVGDHPLTTRSISRRPGSIRQLWGPIRLIFPTPIGSVLTHGLDKLSPAWSRWIGRLGIPILAVALFLALLWRIGGGRAGTPLPRTSFGSVAVLPLKSVGDNPGQIDYLSDGISEALITKLTQLPNLRVIPWITAQRYKEPTKGLLEVAKEMRVDALVTGTLRREGNRIGLAISLIDTQSGLQYWADQFEYQLADIFTLQRRITTGVAAKLKGRLTSQQEQLLSQVASNSAEAYELYLRGRAEMKQSRGKTGLDWDNPKGLGLPLGLFEKALKLDPNLAEAYAAIGEIKGLQSDIRSDFDEAEANYQHALSLNPTLATAYEGLTVLYRERSQGEECLKVGKRAASLGLEDADNLRVRANAYLWGGLTERAIPLFQRVVELDPANEDAQSTLASAYYVAGRMNEAIAAEEVYNDKFGHDSGYIRSLAYLCLDNIENAKVLYDKMGGPVWLDSSFGFLYQHKGQPDKAREYLLHGVATLKGCLKADPKAIACLAALAGFHAALGDRESYLREEATLLRERFQFHGLLAGMGQCHAQLGDMDRAVELIMQDSGNFYHPGDLGCEATHPPGVDQKLRQIPAYREYLREREATLERFRAQY